MGIAGATGATGSAALPGGETPAIADEEMLQMANVAWMVRRDLQINPASCMAVNDADAMHHWSRQYEKGWEPKV